MECGGAWSLGVAGRMAVFLACQMTSLWRHYILLNPDRMSILVTWLLRPMMRSRSIQNGLIAGQCLIFECVPRGTNQPLIRQCLCLVFTVYAEWLNEPRTLKQPAIHLPGQLSGQPFSRRLWISVP